MARAKWPFGTLSPSPTQDTPKTQKAPVRASADAKKFGYENFCNNCYANSVLQALYFCAPFRDLLLQSTDPPVPSTPPTIAPVRRKASETTQAPGNTPPATPAPSAAAPIPTSPASLFSALRSLFFHISSHPAERGTVSPRAFIDKLKDLNQVFNTTTHQDAHEFLNYLLNRIVEEMHEEHSQPDPPSSISPPHASAEDLSRSLTTLSSVPTAASPHSNSRSKNDLTLVHRLFEGVLTSETRCLTCETVSSRDESFLDLSIDIAQNSSLTACLRAFSASEMLCNKNKFFCDACCDLQEAEKRMKIKRLPNVLALHLKRFKYQEDLGRYIKLAYRVAFPFELRLFNTVEEAEDGDRLYRLFGVVVHIGSGPHHGHYVSIIKTLGTWLLFDDENVTPVQEADIPKYFGDSPAGCAYVLYYQAVDIDEDKIGLARPPGSTESEVGSGAAINGNANGIVGGGGKSPSVIVSASDAPSPSVLSVAESSGLASVSVPQPVNPGLALVDHSRQSTEVPGEPTPTQSVMSNGAASSYLSPPPTGTQQQGKMSGAVSGLFKTIKKSPSVSLRVGASSSSSSTPSGPTLLNGNMGGGSSRSSAGSGGSGSGVGVSSSSRSSAGDVPALSARILEVVTETSMRPASPVRAHTVDPGSGLGLGSREPGEAGPPTVRRSVSVSASVTRGYGVPGSSRDGQVQRVNGVAGSAEEAGMVADGAGKKGKRKEKEGRYHWFARRPNFRGVVEKAVSGNSSKASQTAAISGHVAGRDRDRDLLSVPSTSSASSSISEGERRGSVSPSVSGESGTGLSRPPSTNGQAGSRPSSVYEDGTSTPTMLPAPPANGHHQRQHHHPRQLNPQPTLLQRPPLPEGFKASVNGDTTGTPTSVVTARPAFSTTAYTNPNVYHHHFSIPQQHQQHPFPSSAVPIPSLSPSNPPPPPRASPLPVSASAPVAPRAHFEARDEPPLPPLTGGPNAWTHPPPPRRATSDASTQGVDGIAAVQGVRSLPPPPPPPPLLLHGVEGEVGTGLGRQGTITGTLPASPERKKSLTNFAAGLRGGKEKKKGKKEKVWDSVPHGVSVATVGGRPTTAPSAASPRVVLSPEGEAQVQRGKSIEGQRPLPPVPPLPPPKLEQENGNAEVHFHGHANGVVGNGSVENVVSWSKPIEGGDRHEMVHPPPVNGRQAVPVVGFEHGVGVVAPSLISNGGSHSAGAGVFRVARKLSLHAPIFGLGKKEKDREKKNGTSAFVRF